MLSAFRSRSSLVCRLSGKAELSGLDAALSIRPTVIDLFVVGLGLDVFGGYLVARGLLVSPSALKAFGTVAGLGKADVVDRIRNRVDGGFGLALLILGFLLQLLGYLLELNGDRSGHSIDRLVTGLLLLGLAMLAVYGLWRLGRDRLFKRALVVVAKAPALIGGQHIIEPSDKQTEWLAIYGNAAGWPRLMYESDETYVKRVFGLEM
jgi:hypothetical protein